MALANLVENSLTGNSHMSLSALGFQQSESSPSDRKQVILRAKSVCFTFLLLAISLDLNDIGLQVLESLEASLVLVPRYSCFWILCVQGEGPAKVSC